ncbi:hypothetical protein [Peptostreptococcus porci]|uniref:hypothetical protein n=1 Tax=Peptostreptococcus porci TaxID=2652282 RepID=UPI002A81BD90|nr:hypothetical protein [Peptostreptococcus porci]MDY4127734.1 hypothetical protein [Peptostreptococcus porci]
MYNFKINTKGGKSFVVETDIRDAEKFTERVLGKDKPGITVNIFKLLIEDINGNVKYNQVAILNTEIDSIEWYGI